MLTPMESQRLASASSHLHKALSSLVTCPGPTVATVVGRVRLLVGEIDTMLTPTETESVDNGGDQGKRKRAGGGKA